jgi:hypothetical protein
MYSHNANSEISGGKRAGDSGATYPIATVAKLTEQTLLKVFNVITTTITFKSRTSTQHERKLNTEQNPRNPQNEMDNMNIGWKRSKINSKLFKYDNL